MRDRANGRGTPGMRVAVDNPMNPNQNDWSNMLLNASKLEDAELARHASVSTRNRHSCATCFTCACEQVRQQRQVQKMLDMEAARRLHAGGA